MSPSAMDAFLVSKACTPGPDFTAIGAYGTTYHRVEGTLGLDHIMPSLTGNIDQVALDEEHPVRQQQSAGDGGGFRQVLDFSICIRRQGHRLGPFAQEKMRMESAQISHLLQLRAFSLDASDDSSFRQPVVQAAGESFAGDERIPSVTGHDHRLPGRHRRGEEHEEEQCDAATLLGDHPHGRSFPEGDHPGIMQGSAHSSAFFPVDFFTSV